MANPQKENGYTAIANEILEKLVQTPMLVSELKLVLWVIRKTYGYNKKEDIISISQFQKGIKFSRNTVINSLKALVQANILVKRPIPVKQQIAYKFNKNWEEWLPVQAVGLVQSRMSASAIRRIKLVQATGHTKDNTKDNTKDISPIGDTESQYGNPDVNKFIDLLKEQFDLKLLDGSEKENRRYCWLAIKKFGASNLEAIIKIGARDQFWQNNITSFKTLFYKGVQIASKIKENNKTLIIR